MDHKLLGEDDHAFTLENPQGEQFQVAKQGLSDDLISQIKSLSQSMPSLMPEAQANENGPQDLRPVESDTLLSVPDQAFQPKPDAQAPAPVNASPSIPYDLNQNKTEIPYWFKAPKPTDVGQEQSQPQEQSEPQASSNPYLDSLNKTADSINNQHKIMADEEAQKAKIYDQQATIAQGYQNLLAKHINDINNDWDTLQKDVGNKKIDPDRILSKGANNRMIAAIGIAISGLGSGWTGRNSALDLLNKMIDRDVDAQKSDINNRMTLYSKNLEHFKDVSQAMNASILQSAAVTSGLIQKVAAQSNSKQAMDKAQQLIEQLKMSYLPLAQKYADYQIQSQMVGGGSNQGGIPAEQEPTHMKLDPEYMKTRVAIKGADGRERVYRAETPEQRARVKLAQENIEPVMHMIDEMGKLNWSSMPGTAAKAKAEFYRNGIIPRLNKIHPMGPTLTEGDIHLIGQMVADPAAAWSGDTNQLLKNQLLKEHLKDEMDNIYQNNLQGYKGAHQPQLDFKPRK